MTSGHQILFPPLFRFIGGMAFNLSVSSGRYSVSTVVFSLQGSLSTKLFSEARLMPQPFCPAFPFPMGPYIAMTPSHHVHTQLRIFPIRKTILSHQHQLWEALPLILKWFCIEWWMSFHFKGQQTHLLTFSNFLKGPSPQNVKTKQNPIKLWFPITHFKKEQKKTILSYR